MKKEITKLTFFCTKTQEEILRLLNTPEFEDNLEYLFSQEGDQWTFSVVKIPYQLGKRKPIPFWLSFRQQTDGLYLVVEEKEARSVFVNTSLEPELYRFFIQKCECEPVSNH